jgi:hypothetical protein
MQMKFQKASKTLKLLWSETINNTLKLVPAKKTASFGGRLNIELSHHCPDPIVLVGAF